MGDLRTGVGEWLRYLTPAISAAKEYTWAGPDSEQFWEFIRRATVVRQYEALETILRMVDDNHGHFGVTLLRPAYEELIWIRYLNKHPAHARKLCVFLSLHGVGESIKAQSQYAGLKEMEADGFTRDHIESHTRSRPFLEEQIEAIGRELCWPKRGKHLLPSMSHLSKCVGFAREYKFLYHATSRFVHFSTHELARRVWGKKGSVKIGSSSFSEYWSDFAMYWALWLLIHLIREVHDVLGDINSTPQKDEEMIKWLGSLSGVPIVTASELKSWDNELIDASESASGG